MSLESLAETVASLRAEKKKVVHARGSFDLLERTGVERLREMATLADVLVVTVAEGSRAVLPSKLRAEVCAALPFVHAVALEEGRPVEEVLRRVGADLVVDHDEAARRGSAGDVVGVHDAEARREILYPRRDGFTPQAEAFLRHLRTRYTAEDVIAAIGTLRDAKVLVVGDTIIDEYHFVRPYGMPQKAAVIAAQFLEAEVYAGGILAVANHIAGFCDRVDLLTVLGERDSREEFIRGRLRPNVRPSFLFRPDAPTTTKRRYVGRYLVQKLFEVAFFDDTPLPAPLDAALAKRIDEEAAGYDLVVVADFGHGMLSGASIAALSRRARFLALNTQLNSINYGFHVITKYDRADYVCIDEPEIRMAMRDRTTPVADLVAPLARSLQASAATVTLGSHGSLTYLRDRERVAVPILSRQVVDTVGAGDAYLSISSLCASRGMDPELMGFIGNAVGGLAVRVVGNKESVGPETLFPFIRLLME